MARNMEQEFRRSPEEIFRLDEVFNTGVENVVQKRRRNEVNPPLLNTLMRFAQFLCNGVKRERFFGKNEPKRKREVVCLARSMREEKHLRKYFRC